jgi:hypothetical protein
MDLKFRKVHIDSRFRATGSHSDFTFELAEPFDCPDGTICYMDNAVIPMSWDSVGEHNKYLYLAERDRTNLPYVYHVRRLELSKQFYSGITLRKAIEDQLNANVPSPITNNYAVAYDSSSNALTISHPGPDPPNSDFYLLTDDDLKYYNSNLLAINKSNTQSANNVLRNLESSQIITAVENYPYVTSWTSPFIDIVNHHSVYIHSSLSSFNTLGCRGESSIIAKVPSSASWGSTIFHNVSSSVDFVDVGKRNISHISFAIKDAAGNNIDLKGASWSLSLVFAIKE